MNKTSFQPGDYIKLRSTIHEIIWLVESVEGDRCVLKKILYDTFKSDNLIAFTEHMDNYYKISPEEARIAKGRAI